jgi:hypothetical protein
MRLLFPGESGIQQIPKAFPRQALDGFIEKNGWVPVSL